MAVSLSPFAGAGWQFFSDNGVPLAGGKLYVYSAGTTSSAVTYTSSTGATANTNPIILNAAGRLANEIWLTVGLNYKFILKTSTDTLIGTWDNIPAGTTDVADLQAALASSSGAGMIGYTQGGTYSVATTVQSKLRETVSVFDFMTAEQIANVKAGTSTDDTTEINNAFASGKSVYFPDGTYIASALTLSSSNVNLSGNGIIKKKSGVDGKLLTISGNNNEIVGLRFDGTNSQPSSNYLNDIITINGTNNLIENCYINGSYGGGITIGNASGNRILNNIIKNVYDNGVLVAGAGADVNIISGNWIDGTTTQNNIFITASADSTPNGQYVYGNIVTNNYCANSGDTGIESGYHAQRTLIANNITTTSYNPGILVRDGFGVNVVGNIVINKTYASQPSTYDGIAVVPQTNRRHMFI